MKLYTLVPMDSRFNDWLFWYEDDAGYVKAKPFYSDLVCPRCGKLDELAAIERGFDPQIKIQSKRDFIEMCDDIVVVSRQARETFNEVGIKGIRFLGLPDGNHSVPWPEVRVPTDLSKAGFEFEGPKCTRCGRYRGVYVGPLSAGLTVPDDPMVVFASEIWNESWRGRVLWLFAQEPVGRALKLRRLSGLEIIEA